MRGASDAGLMLGRRRRWWANVNPALGELHVFAVISVWVVIQQTRCINAGLMLAHRLQCCSNIDPALFNVLPAEMNYCLY